ncbi:MAG: hypothetical protein WC533_04820 [Candidatus Pacearchaeota archaeon]
MANDKANISVKDVKTEFLREIALSIAGKNAGAMVDLLIGKENVNEFIIAKKLGLTINQVRNILYKLSDEGLVSFIRKKDKKKGWYTYFWTFDDDKSLSLLKKSLLDEISRLQGQLKSREIKQFYICKTCNVELTEENAMLHDFTCPECGEIYGASDSSSAISEIESSINKLRKRLEKIDFELNIIKIEKEKKAVKRAVKAERAAKELRKQKRDERAAKKIRENVQIKKIHKVNFRKKQTKYKVIKKAKKSPKKSALKNRKKQQRKK